MDHLRIEPARQTDADRLANMRSAAMRPSLQAIGRFDPDRARNRFLASFEVSDTSLVYSEQSLAGFFVLRNRTDHLYLDHLYVADAFQGQGIGGWVIAGIQARARAEQLPIRLMSLSSSPANQFYRSCGFVFVSDDGLDTVYEWKPHPE